MLPHAHKVHEASSKGWSPKALKCNFWQQTARTEFNGTEAVLQAVNECMLAVDCASTAKSWNTGRAGTSQLMLPRRRAGSRFLTCQAVSLTLELLVGISEPRCSPTRMQFLHV